MVGRKFVAAASFILATSGAASAQTAGSDAARTEDLIKQAVEQYAAGLEASRARTAQDAAAPPAVPMTLDDAVRRAIDNNLEMAVERLNPQTFDFTLAALRANYKPVATSSFGRRDNVRPPTNLLNPGSPNVSTTSYNTGIAQNLSWGGGNLALSFNNSRIDSADLLANFNPQYNSSYLFSYTQPLLRGFRIDQVRQQIQTTEINRDNAELNLKARNTNTLAAVRSAYWDYVYSIQAVDVARQSLALASKLLSDNKIRVEVGTMAPMDVVQAEAEQAMRQQALTTATATMRTAELSLKRLIVSGTNDPLWSQHIDPVDRPEFQTVSIDVAGAVRAALQQRTDLQVARNNVETNTVLLKSQRNLALPDVDAIVTYGASGLGGVQYKFDRPTGLDRQRIGVLVDGGYSNALRTLYNREYPNWQFALNVNYPIGGNAAEAQAARTRLLIQQNQAQIRASELTVATEVTNAALQVTNSTEALAAARAARELSQRRLDAEMSRFEVGMSNNYQVVQSQRDLREAQNSELRALLNYRKALVEFDRVQQAGAR